MCEELISRNAVMDYLREQQASVIIEKNKNGFVSSDVCYGMISAIGAFMNFIVQMPEAYSADKVVERPRSELDLADKGKERCSRENPLQFDEAKGYARGIAGSMEIVKSGGIE